MKQIKLRSRMERVLRTLYIVMYAFRSNKELFPGFQGTGTLVPFGIPAESGRNVQPRPERGIKSQSSRARSPIGSSTTSATQRCR